MREDYNTIRTMLNTDGGNKAMEAIRKAFIEYKMAVNKLDTGLFSRIEGATDMTDVPEAEATIIRNIMTKGAAIGVLVSIYALEEAEEEYHDALENFRNGADLEDLFLELECAGQGLNTSIGLAEAMQRSDWRHEENLANGICDECDAHNLKQTGTDIICETCGLVMAEEVA